MRLGLLFLTLLLASSPVESAPAPVYKGLPEEIQILLDNCAGPRGLPGLIEKYKIDIRNARTAKERESMVSTVEKFERETYSMPVKILEAALGNAEYPGREEQEAIRRALEKYRLRRDDARARGLFKPEPPTTEKKAPR